ncbi:hypothetical protein PF005_g16092 [Phytophthora fragariae]|uniref:Secreted protein n=1 Tax=Phytophthora fragariae TaxID=53985 RepID=A0A6A3XHE4_9STRA|nr:hypothetical protein PF003_g28470 [Phytophthora fragariae]KAE8931332.1 hypothetical protein PF009_g18615 [Phytophthora fragariae]KAE8995480.1 hypothetical protein PF011_g16315 [Phytophthora fragariae]KAE9095017.1 hypothetical protein PF007_g17560 [Phytophthora fragariae]KAE9097954.1 hypothetical protein PF010_g15757 [Phytophthora fragariae]
MWYHIFCVSALLCVCFYGSVLGYQRDVSLRSRRCTIACFPTVLSFHSRGSADTVCQGCFCHSGF